MSLPVLRPLARAQPRRPLIVFAKSGPAAVYRAAAEGTVDYVVVASGRLWSDVAALRRSRPEEVWILPNSFRSALLAFLSGARERIGYDTDGRGFLLTHRRPAPPPMRHQVHDYDDLLTSRGLEAADWDPELKPTGEALAAAPRAQRGPGQNDGRRSGMAAWRGGLPRRASPSGSSSGRARRISRAERSRRRASRFPFSAPTWIPAGWPLFSPSRGPWWPTTRARCTSPAPSAPRSSRCSVPPTRAARDPWAGKAGSSTASSFAPLAFSGSARTRTSA